MNKKVKLLISISAFAVFIILAFVAYNLLSDKFKPQNSGIPNIVTSKGESQPSSSQDTNSNNSASGSSEEEKIKIPDFTLTDIDGNEVTLEDLKGKPMVINFWATWCGYCKEEMPFFDTAYLANKDDIQFIMVDAVDGQRETVEKGKKFIEDNDYSFPVFFDISQEMIYSYGVTSFPSTLFVDKDLNAIAGYQGAIDEETLLLGIETLKGEKSE